MFDFDLSYQIFGKLINRFGLIKGFVILIVVSLVRSRLAGFQEKCKSLQTFTDGCSPLNYAACLQAYMKMIGTCWIWWSLLGSLIENIFLTLTSAVQMGLHTPIIDASISIILCFQVLKSIHLWFTLVRFML